MAISKDNTRTMVTMSLDLKKELDLKSKRDNDNLNRENKSQTKKWNSFTTSHQQACV